MTRFYSKKNDLDQKVSDFLNVCIKYEYIFKLPAPVWSSRSCVYGNLKPVQFFEL